MATAGYSGTPLAKKLGMKEGFIISLINAPEHYYSLFGDTLPDVTETADKKMLKDLVHFFTKDSKELIKLLPQLKKQLVPNGTIWVSWPKKAAKIPTDISEDVIRDYALSIRLVDVKVCAVDDVWSGLKLVIPVKDRKG